MMMVSCFAHVKPHRAPVRDGMGRRTPKGDGCTEEDGCVGYYVSRTLNKESREGNFQEHSREEIGRVMSCGPCAGESRRSHPNPVDFGRNPDGKYRWTVESAFAIPRGDGLPVRPRSQRDGAADRMMGAISGRRLTEDHLPVDWWSAEVSGAP